MDTAILFAFDKGYLQPGLVAVSTALRYSPSVVRVFVASHGPSTPTVLDGTNRSYGSSKTTTRSPLPGAMESTSGRTGARCI